MRAAHNAGLPSILVSEYAPWNRTEGSCGPPGRNQAHFPILTSCSRWPIRDGWPMENTILTVFNGLTVLGRRE